MSSHTISKQDGCAGCGLPVGAAELVHDRKHREWHVACVVARRVAAAAAQAKPPTA